MKSVHLTNKTIFLELHVCVCKTVVMDIKTNVYLHQV